MVSLSDLMNMIDHTSDMETMANIIKDMVMADLINICSYDIFLERLEDYHKLYDYLTK